MDLFYINICTSRDGRQDVFSLKAPFRLVSLISSNNNPYTNLVMRNVFLFSFFIFFSVFDFDVEIVCFLSHILRWWKNLVICGSASFLLFID